MQDLNIILISSLIYEKFFCNLADTVRLCLFNNKGRIYFIERSYLTKKLLSNDFLKKRGLEIFNWNYNDLRRWNASWVQSRNRIFK